jgi:GTP-binding protein
VATGRLPTPICWCSSPTGRDGLVAGDREIARVAREANRPLLLAINKMDDKKARAGALDFYQLGIDPVFEISAEHGEGVGDLLDGILEGCRTCRPGPKRTRCPRTWRPKPRPAPGKPPTPDEVGIAIVGRPNAGKSSLVNRLLREER